MKKILIADHVRANRDVMARVLKAKGLEYVTVSRGHDVIHLDPNEIMLVLISQQLQDMSAFEVMERLQANSYISTLPFIICSADNTPSFLRRCGEAGFAEILLRPFNRRRIYQAVRDLLLDRKLLTVEDLPDQEEVTVTTTEKLAFLQYLMSQANPRINPLYDASVPTAYSYPIITEFFALEPGEGYEILREFTNDGFLSRDLFDKVNICPPCNWHTVNLREICPNCSSLDIAVEEVIHHFACGYVGPGSDFSVPGTSGMQCPKCDKRLRHIGLDYEKPTDTFVCHSCQYIFTDPEVDFNCFFCGYKGKAEELSLIKIYTYRPTMKARKAIEQQSLTTSTTHDLIKGSEEGLVSRDYFEFALRQRHLALTEFGDELHLAVVSLPPGGENQITELAELLSGSLNSLDALARLDETHLAVMLSRRPANDLEQIRENILQFTTEKGMECRVIVRSFEKGKDNIDKFLGEMERRIAEPEASDAGKKGN